ncbi:MAG TPA: SDR family oxidoreductase, partial [Phycisphaerae bacterium]
YSRALAREVAGENIQVNILAPNMTETDLLAMLPGMIVKRIAAGRPAARNLEPIEVAQAIAFLVSQWSNGMTGQKLVLNLGEPPFA